MLFCLRDAVFLFVIVIVSLSRGGNSDSATCTTWQSVATTSTRFHPDIKLNCVKSNSCTGINCTGIYSYSYNIGPIKALANDIDFCFGVRQACPSSSFDVYLQDPAKNVTFVERVQDSVHLIVPGLRYYPISGQTMVAADVFLEVTINPQGNVTSFGVALTVRINSFFGDTWPGNLKRSLVPIRIIPKCNQVTGKAPPQLTVGTCSPMSAGHTPKPTHPTTTTQNPYTPDPVGTYGKPCNLSMAFSCQMNEMCAMSQKCLCLPEYKIGPSGTCQGAPSTKAVTTMSQTTHKTSTSAPVAVKTNKSGQTAVIAGSVVASVIGILILAGIAVFCHRLRKARARYADHEVLLNNDDMVM